MADYNESIALDLDLFDNTKNGYVPVEKKKKDTHVPKLLKREPISEEQAYSEVRNSRIAAIKACTFALVALLIFGSLIFSRVKLTDYKSDLAKATAQYELAKSENVRLQMRFNSIMSMDNIEEYAQTKLGMVKKESYQVRYFDLSEDSGAKVVNKD